MRESLFVSILLGLLAAVIVHIVGTAVTSFEDEGLVWGLVAVLVFVVVAFGDRSRRGRGL